MIQTPIIKKIHKEETKIELLLAFEKSAIYFQGHFEGTPILPGFVQIHFAMFFIAQNWEISGDLSNIKRLKFTRIIPPEVDVTLILEKISADKISFKYQDEKHVYSSGEFHLQGDRK